MAMIFDRDAMTSIMLMPSQKMYIKTAVTPPTAPPATHVTDPNASFVNTGTTKTIAGASCQVYHGASTRDGKANAVDICIAKGVGLNPADFTGLMGGPKGSSNLPPELAAAADALKDGGVLEVISTQNGQPRGSMRATQIDPSPPSDVLFAPPPGFQAMQMPAGMAGGMPGMPGGMPGMPPAGGTPKPQ